MKMQLRLILPLKMQLRLIQLLKAKRRLIQLLKAKRRLVLLNPQLTLVKLELFPLKSKRTLKLLSRTSLTRLKY